MPAPSKTKLPKDDGGTSFRVRTGTARKEGGGEDFTYDRYPTSRAAIAAAKPEKRTTIIDIEQLHSHTWLLLRRWVPGKGWKTVAKEVS